MISIHGVQSDGDVIRPEIIKITPAGYLNENEMEEHD